MVVLEHRENDIKSVTLLRMPTVPSLSNQFQFEFTRNNNFNKTKYHPNSLNFSFFSDRLGGNFVSSYENMNFINIGNYLCTSLESFGNRIISD